MSNTDDLEQATKNLQDNLKNIKKKEEEDTANMIKELNTVASNVKEETTKSNDLIKKIDEEAERKRREEEERLKREEEERIQKKATAKKISDSVIQMCEDKGSKVKDIETELGKLTDELKEHVDFNDLNEKVKEFKSKVESQKEKIETFVKELKEIKSEDALEKFEKKVKSEVEDKLYADNKQQFDTLEQKMEKKVDTLEDESIIGGVIALLPKEAYDKKEQDIANIRTIVEAKIPQMLEEVTQEINDIKKYLETHDDKFLGVEKYDLTPQGVEAVSKYINQNPESKENKKDDTKVTKEKNKEHNIDILNLILGGIMTQDFRDIMNTKSKGKLKHLTKYLDIANEFIKAIEFSPEENKQLDKIFTALEKSIEDEKKGSKFGASAEEEKKTKEDFEEVLKNLHMSLKYAIDSTQIAKEILEGLDKHEEKYKEFKASLKNIKKSKFKSIVSGRNNVIKKKLLPIDGSFAFNFVLSSYGLTPGKVEGIITKEDKEKLINSLILLDHYFDDKGKLREKPTSNLIINTVKETDNKFVLNQESNIKKDLKAITKEFKQKTGKLNFGNTRRKNKFGVEKLFEAAGNILSTSEAASAAASTAITIGEGAVNVANTGLATMTEILESLESLEPGKSLNYSIIKITQDLMSIESDLNMYKERKKKFKEAKEINEKLTNTELKKIVDEYEFDNDTNNEIQNNIKDLQVYSEKDEKEALQKLEELSKPEKELSKPEISISKAREIQLENQYEEKKERKIRKVGDVVQFLLNTDKEGKEVWKEGKITKIEYDDDKFVDCSIEYEGEEKEIKSEGDIVDKDAVISSFGKSKFGAEVPVNVTVKAIAAVIEAFNNNKLKKKKKKEGEKEELTEAEKKKKIDELKKHKKKIEDLEKIDKHIEEKESKVEAAEETNNKLKKQKRKWAIVNKFKKLREKGGTIGGSVKKLFQKKKVAGKPIKETNDEEEPNKITTNKEEEEEHMSEDDYKKLIGNYPHLESLQNILNYYFKYENEKWKFKDGTKENHDKIIEYFKNPKYIINVDDEKSKIVKCHGVLEKLSKKYPRKYEKIIGDFKNEVNKVNDKDLLNNQLLEYKDDKWVINSGLENETVNKQIIIQDPLFKIDKEMEKVEDQLKLKMKFLNTIMKKYALLAKKKVKSELGKKDDGKIQDVIQKIIQDIKNPGTSNLDEDKEIKDIIKDIIKDGYELAANENKDITVPFNKAIHARMEDYTNITKSHNEKLEQDILKKRVKHVIEALPPHVILAKNLKKLNIKKKKDYSSFKDIPDKYDPVVVKNEVSEKLYEKLEKIKDNQSFGKSKRKNKFGSSGQSGDVDIKQIRAEASDELVDIINEKLGENLVGKIFKPKIEEDEVRNLIAAIPNERLRVKMTKKLDSKLKNTQPASLEDLNRKINKDTSELTKNTNKIYDKVKNLVDRIHKKDKRIIQLKNEIEREKSISITKLSNNKETFELNRKNLQEQLNARNREIENIEAKQLNNHRRLVAQFSRINLQDKSKKEELTRILNETKSNNLKELQELRVTIQNNYNRQLKSVIKNLEQKKNQELQLERNKLAEAERKAEEKIKAQVAQALQTKKTYENALRSQERKYTKLAEQAKKQCSERNNKIDEVCKQKIVELKTDYKNFERRVGRIFDKQRQDNEKKIKKIEEEAEKEVQKGSEESKAKVLAYREEIKRLKGIANDLNNRQNEALGKGIERRENKIKLLEEMAVKNKEIGTQKLAMTEKKLMEDLKNKKEDMNKQLKDTIELNKKKSILDTQANTMEIQKNANVQVEQIKNKLENEVDKIEENAEERIKKAEAETDKIKKEAKEELEKRLLELKTQEDTLLKQFNEELDKASKESQGTKADFEKMKAKLTEDYNKNMETIRQQKYDVQQKANEQLARQEQLLRDKEDRMKQTNEKRLREAEDRMKKQEQELYKKKVDSEVDLVNEKNKLKIKEMETKRDLEEKLRKTEDKVIDKGMKQSEDILQTSYQNRMKELDQRFKSEKEQEVLVEQKNKEIENLKKQQEDLVEQNKKQQEDLLEQNKKQLEELQKQQEQKQKEDFKKQQEQATVKIDSTKKAIGPNVFDTLKSRVQKYTKGLNLFKTEIKDGKTVTFETWITTNKIPKEIAPDFERFHRTRIAKSLNQDAGTVGGSPEYDNPREILKSWLMFNMQKAGKFVKKNSKKIAAVAAVTGAAVAGTKAVKRRRKTSPKRKKRSTSRRRKTSPKRKTSPRRKKRGTSPKRKRKTSPRRRKKTKSQAEKLLKDVRKILKA